MSTTYHMCLNVREAIRWPNKRLKGMFKHPTENRSMTADESLNVLMDHLSQGHEVIPFGICDNFDFTGGGCRGHKEDQQ